MSVGPTPVAAEPLIDDAPRTLLGESPRWDGSAWWWVDARAGEVWTRRPAGPASLAWRTGRRTSLVHPAGSGRQVVACDQALYVLERDGRHGGWAPTDVWCDLGVEEGWLVNDGVADVAGRLWIGAIAPGRTPLGGALLRVDPDRTVTRAATGFTFSNGMAWSAGGALLHVDTLERTVWRHQVDVGSGDVLSSEAFLTFSADDGLPDGIATDTDGGVWVAMYGAGEVRHFDAAGAFDRAVTVDAPQCTSVGLGGPDGRDLLITTAREGYDEARSGAEPGAGRLYRSRCSAPGAPLPMVVVGTEGRP